MVELESAYRTPDGPRGVDAIIRALAETQHGVVEYRQLVAAGVSRSAIGRRVRAGRLVVIHRGVYAVGHALLPAHGREMAAVLAGGKKTVLSHRSIGARLGLVRWTGRVEITTPRRDRQLEHVSVHTSRSLSDEDRTTIGPIPCTAWARALIDMATLLPHHRLVRAIEQSMINRLYDQSTLDAAVQRAHGHHGIKALTKAVAAAPTSPQKTRSGLEDRFLALIRSADPPVREYEGNAWLILGDDEFEVDALWRDERLVVELDSGVHDTPARPSPRRSQGPRSPGPLLLGAAVQNAPPHRGPQPCPRQAPPHTSDNLDTSSSRLPRNACYDPR